MSHPAVIAVAKRQAQGLAFCMAVVLGLHAALLAWPQKTRGERHVAQTTALEVRMVSSSTPTPTLAAVPQPLPNPRTEESPAASMQRPVQGEPHADAQAPQLDNPDAPLPDGHGQARVWLAVESDGYVRELRVEPEVLPRAFERAIERGFTGARVNAEPALLRSGSVCVEVTFREGEPPSWQPVQPAGACVASA